MDDEQRERIRARAAAFDRGELTLGFDLNKPWHPSQQRVHLPPPPKHRGFAAMSPEKRQEIARKGGQTAQAKGTAYRWDSASARRAGEKGGVIVGSDSAHMAAIGRKGGRIAAERKAQAKRLAQKEALERLIEIDEKVRLSASNNTQQVKQVILPEDIMRSLGVPIIL